MTPVDRLVAIMARLRDPATGCEWDRAQTGATIAPYTIEEAYEVADAIARDDRDDLKDELGDLLLQVVFHSRIAEEAGAFALDDVATAISDKLERRHPHIFSDAEHEPGFWERIKAEERAGKAQNEAARGALAGVAAGLPALTRAEKLQKRAARVGFDWPDASGPRAKIDEELAEVAEASDDERAEEIGDLLFAVVNWARHLGIDAEAALRGANAKFERRFAAMEAEAGDGFPALSLQQKERLWTAIKHGGNVDRFGRAALEAAGFRGWVPLTSARQSVLPQGRGIYMISYPDWGHPALLITSPAGWFKGDDPTLPLATAAANWVDGAQVVYIGKASCIRRRLIQFADFGAGKPVGHWGGRLLWQLPDPAALKVAWLETPGDDPAAVEAEWLAAFRAHYGKAPFANDPQKMGR